MVSNWEPAHSLVEDAVSGAEIARAPCLPAVAVAHLPLPQGREGRCGIQLALLWYLLAPLFCECTVQALDPFAGKVWVFFWSLWRSHGLGCYLRLAPSDCSQDIQAHSLP